MTSCPSLYVPGMCGTACSCAVGWISGRLWAQRVHLCMACVCLPHNRPVGGPCNCNKGALPMLLLEMRDNTAMLMQGLLAAVLK